MVSMYERICTLLPAFTSSWEARRRPLAYEHSTEMNQLAGQVNHLRDTMSATAWRSITSTSRLSQLILVFKDQGSGHGAAARGRGTVMCWRQSRKR